MSSNTEQRPDRWGEAFDARERVIRAHPLYPRLFRKVARWEVYFSTGRPISRRYRNAPYELAWRKTLITHDEPSQESVRKSMDRVALAMLDDVFPKPWPARGDMLAAICGAATTDVRIDRR